MEDSIEIVFEKLIHVTKDTVSKVHFVVSFFQNCQWRPNIFVNIPKHDIHILMCYSSFKTQYSYLHKFL